MTRTEVLCRWSLVAAYHTWLVRHGPVTGTAQAWLAYADALGLACTYRPQDHEEPR